MSTHDLMAFYGGDFGGWSKISMSRYCFVLVLGRSISGKRKETNDCVAIKFMK